MDRLNYFNPYQSKDSSHEDQLTRAYLVLLKYSCHAFFIFIEYVRSKHITKNTEKPISILEFLESGWEIKTQKRNPEINTNYLVSILITDENLASYNETVKLSERNARYDGIITFGNSLTMVIENKPRSSNVWFEQLYPSRQNLSDDTLVYKNSSKLEGKEIIKQLNFLLTTQTISSYEKILIEDFLSYVDENFPFLNPYDNFHQCKGNAELLNRRIHNILLSIARDKNKVLYHKGWGYYIQTPFQQIHEIGLILNKDEKDWWIDLSLFFGASQRQAISFYSSHPKVYHLEKSKWRLCPNFHVSFMNTNLVFFPSKNSEIYLRFWIEHYKEIAQQKRENVSNYLQRLVNEKVIYFTSEIQEKLNEKFYTTAMQTLNMCPEFGIIYTFSSSEIEESDKKGKFQLSLIEKINEGLRIVGLDKTDEFLKPV